MILNKLKNLLLEISNYNYLDITPIENWKLTKSIYDDYNNYSKVTEPIYINVGEKWGQVGETGLFEKRIKLGQYSKGQAVYLEVVTGGEAQCYVNNKAFYGNDPNHYRILLTKRSKGTESYEVKIESYVRVISDSIGNSSNDIGATGTFSKADIAVVNLEAQELIGDIKFAIELAEAYEEFKYTIEENLSKLFVSFDLYNKQDFYDKLHRLKSIVNNVMEKINVDKKNTEVCMINQSHLDIAWLWRRNETKRKIVRTFSSALRNIERYDGISFMMPQPYLYDLASQVNEDLLEEIKVKVREGTWENLGQMFVEPDTNLITGESFVRHIIAGREIQKNLFGKVSKLESLIDAFGYSGNIPQMLVKSEIDGVLVSKMRWYNDTTVFPYSAFRWKGIDGTEILASSVPCFNCNATPGSIKHHLNKNMQKESLNILPVLMGWGDGGGGADENHFEGLSRLNKWFPKAKVKSSTAKDYFKKLKERNSKLPIWWGEIYQEGHRGCYTSQARIKYLNRESEKLYRTLEYLYSLIYINTGENLFDKLKENNKLLLLNQFHDVLPGSGITAIYDDAKEEYNKILIDGKKCLEEAVEKITNNIVANDREYKIVLFNFNATFYEQYVDIDLHDEIEGTIYDEYNNVVKYYKHGNKIKFKVNKMPQVGYKVYTFVPGKVKGLVREKNNSSSNILENKYYKISFGDNGMIRSIYDKTVYREILRESGCGKNLKIYFDYPMSCDAWDIDSDYKENEYILNCESISGPFIEGSTSYIRLEYKYNNSSIYEKVLLDKDSRLIGFNYEVDWRESHKLLKVEFDTDILATKAKYDIPFGVIERDCIYNSDYQKARFEVSALNFCDISEGNYGVAILSEHKYGYGVCDGKISLSLLRSPMHPDPLADKDIHNFTYYLHGHSGNFNQSNVVSISKSMFQPILARVIKNSSIDYSYTKVLNEILSIKGDKVSIEAIKLSEKKDGLIIRLCEYNGSRTNVSINFNIQIEKILETNLVETEIQELFMNDNTIKLEIRPYEVKTLKLILKNQKNNSI